MFDEEKHRTHNSTYTQVGVQCIYESEVLNPSSVLLMKFSAKNPHLRVAANRYMHSRTNVLNKIKPKYDLIKWYVRIVMIIVVLFIMTVLYIWSCTNSLHDLVIVNFNKPIIASLKIVEYTTVGLIMLTLIIRKEVINQYLQMFGLMILLCVFIVSLLSFVPCTQDYAQNRNLKEILNRSLLCPQFSNRSWINIFWFGAMGIVNYGLPIILRLNKMHITSPTGKAAQLHSKQSRSTRS